MEKLSKNLSIFSFNSQIIPSELLGLQADINILKS
jgi:hypothetical protein